MDASRLANASSLALYVHHLFWPSPPCQYESRSFQLNAESVYYLALSILPLILSFRLYTFIISYYSHTHFTRLKIYTLLPFSIYYYKSIYTLFSIFTCFLFPFPFIHTHICISWLPLLHSCSNSSSIQSFLFLFCSHSFLQSVSRLKIIAVFPFFFLNSWLTFSSISFSPF